MKRKIVKKTIRMMLVVAMMMTVFLPIGVIAFEDKPKESIQEDKEVEYTIDYTLHKDKTSATIHIAINKDPSLVLKKCQTYDAREIAFDSLKSQDQTYYIDDVVMENNEYTYTIYYQTMVFENDVLSYVDKERTISIVIDDIILSKETNGQTTINNDVQPRAFEITSGNFMYTILDDTSVAVAGRYGSNVDLEIPETITSGGKTYNVTAIADNAFYTSKTIKSIVIPNSITSIGEGAFMENTSMTSITIPGSVKTMGRSIFSTTKSLRTVVFEEGITDIPAQMFQFATALTSVTLPSTIKSIGNSAFDDTGLTTINFPEGLQTIGSSAFSGCKLTSITIPGSVTSFDVGAFGSCEQLQTVRINDGVTELPAYTFARCTKLLTVTLPDSITTIGNYAFDWCSALQTVELVEGTTPITEFGKMGISVFQRCLSLETITLPTRISNIGTSAFEGCESLTGITIPDSVTKINDKAFYNCTALTEATLSKTLTSLGQSAFQDCRKLNKLNFPEDSILQNIGANAFNGCLSLIELKLPKSVKSISTGAFFNCKYMKNVYFNHDITSIGSEAFRQLPSTVKFYINSPTVLSANEKDINYVKKYLCNEYGFVSTVDSSPYFYKYDETGKTGNIFFGNISNLYAIGNTTLSAPRGSSLDLKVSVGINNVGVNNHVTWSILNASDPDTTFSMINNTCQLQIGTKETGPLSIVATSDFDPSKTITYTVNVTGTKYTVSFDSDGGSAVNSVSVEENKTVSRPSNPTKKGYAFSGWYTDASCTTEWDFTNDVVTGDITLYAKWIAKDCTIYFEMNGITTPATIPNQIKKTGEKVEKPVDPARPGYTFAGWFSNIGLTSAWDFDNQTVLGTMKLYAKWVAMDWTITFDTNGGSSVSDCTVKTDKKIPIPSTPTKDGYIFSGWYTDSSLSTAWDFDNDVVSDDITLYAKWTEDQKTVSFNTNGGSQIDAVSIIVGSTLTKPTDPIKAGYTFNGWYTDSSLSTAWNFASDKVTSDMTLYASWLANDNTIIFNSNGGNAINNSTVKTGEKITEPATPTKQGYTFVGWYKESSLTTAWNFATDIVTEDVTLYAKWEALQWTVSFVMNGNTIPTSIPNQSVLTDEKITKVATPLRNGYTFVGWYSDASLTDAWNFETDVVLADVTLYAKWEAMNWTVTFITNGDSVINDVTVKTDNKILPPSTPTKLGYTFVNWYSDASFSTLWNFDTDTVNKDMTLYAKWQANDNTVTFDSNGGTYIADSTVKTDEKITEPMAPTRNGYTFGGWYSDRTFTTIWDFENAIVNGNMTLYAKWVVNPFTVTFDSNGGSYTPTSQIVEVNQKVSQPINLVKKGYTLVGWYSDEAFTSGWDFNVDTVSSDITLYAKWQANDNIITFNSSGGNKIQNIVVQTGNTIIKPENPKRSGYTFMGWYSDNTYTNIWDFEHDIVSENMTLYAKWQANIYTVSFVLNGNTIPSIITNQSIEMDALVVEPVKPLRAGYTFVGWYKNQDLTEVWNFATDTLQGDMTLYAKWQAMDWIVSFESNGGSSINDITIQTGKKIIQPDLPIRDGYVFSGWYSDSSFTNIWNFEENIVDRNITLYAKWTVHSYTVAFDSNGGNYTPLKQTIEIDNLVKEPVAPTKVGYIFIGWYSDEEYTTLWDFTSDTVQKDVTLYAKWETISIEQEQVDAVVTNIPSGIVTKNTLVTLSVATPGAKIFYTLDGSEPDLTSDVYESPIVIEQNCTIKTYAIKEGMLASSIKTYCYTVKTTGEVSITVDVDNSEIGMTVLDENQIMDAVLTDNDKQAYKEGQDVVIVLDCKLMDSTNMEIPTSDVQQHTIGQYLDISVYKKIGNKEMEAVETLNKEIELKLDIPTLLLPNEGVHRVYKMLRIHDGTTTILNDLDTELSTITIATDRFSMYVLVYTDNKTPEIIVPEEHNVVNKENKITILHTNDVTENVVPYFLTMAGSFVLLVVMKKKWE